VFKSKINYLFILKLIVMKVKIKEHPKTGEIINNISTSAKDGKEYGTIRVDQAVLDANGGFLNKKNRTAFIRGEKGSLLDLCEGLKDGDDFPLGGKILILESHTPFYDNQSPKINPETGEVVKADGRAVYRAYEWTDDMSAQDVFLRDAIKDSVESELDALGE
jgi:hypothetical protein